MLCLLTLSYSLQITILILLFVSLSQRLVWKFVKIFPNLRINILIYVSFPCGKKQPTSFINTTYTCSANISLQKCNFFSRTRIISLRSWVMEIPSRPMLKKRKKVMALSIALGFRFSGSLFLEHPENFGFNFFPVLTAKCPTQWGNNINIITNLFFFSLLF